MLGLIVPEYQLITNKISAKQDFTWDLKPQRRERYIVGQTTLWKGNNPSIDPEMVVLVSNVIKRSIGDVLIDSIGGWNDVDTGKYEVMVNTHYFTEKAAMIAAQITNQKYIWDRQDEKLIKV